MEDRQVLGIYRQSRHEQQRMPDDERNQRAQDQRRDRFINFMLNQSSEADGLEQAFTRVIEAENQQQVIEILSEFIGKRKVERLIEQIYSLLQLQRKRQFKIELLYKHLLLSQKLQIQEIDKLRQLAQLGKKYRFYKLLKDYVKQNTALRLYQEYQSEIQQKHRKPYQHCELIPMENQDNHQQRLNVYRYPEKYEVDNHQKDLAKTLLVIGQTGGGKSSLINCMVNYLQGIDIDDNYRYKIVVQSSQNHKQSVTDDIKFYYAKNRTTNNIYRIIDTPGFGDTKGKYFDHMTRDKIKQFIKERIIQEVHGVLLVIKSNTNRFTQFYRYILQMVMNLFGKDIIQNLSFVFTFDNGSQPLALQTVKDKEDGFGQYWQSFKEPKYIQVQNSSMFQKISAKRADSDSVQINWKRTVDNLSKMFAKIDSSYGNSLNYSREIIVQKQLLRKKISASKDNLLLLNQKFSQHLKLLQKIGQYSKQINQNKSFQFNHNISMITPYAYKKYVIKCKICLDKNCKINCENQRISLKNFDNFDQLGTCMMCDKKCSYKVHQISKTIRRIKKMVVTETDKTLKANFQKASLQQSNSETLAKSIAQKIQNIKEQTLKLAEDIIRMQNQLSQICLSKKKQQNIKEYLQQFSQRNQQSVDKSKNKQIQLFKFLIEDNQIIEKYGSSLIQQYCLSIMQEVENNKKQLQKQKQHFKAETDIINNKRVIFVTKAEAIMLDQDQIDKQKVWQLCRQNLAEKRKEYKANRRAIMNQRHRLFFLGQRPNPNRSRRFSSAYKGNSHISSSNRTLSP